MRKPEFKAKELDSEKWVFGYYYQDEDLHFIMGLDNYHYSIDPSTISQLITEIDGVKIFEFDCWYKDNKIQYCYYNEKGLLTKEVKISHEILEYIENFTTTEVVADYDGLGTSKFIGNWHDGEQYLLDKIKELGNEKEN